MDAVSLVGVRWETLDASWLKAMYAYLVVVHDENYTFLAKESRIGVGPIRLLVVGPLGTAPSPSRSERITDLESAGTASCIGPNRNRLVSRCFNYTLKFQKIFQIFCHRPHCGAYIILDGPHMVHSLFCLLLLLGCIYRMVVQPGALFLSLIAKVHRIRILQLQWMDFWDGWRVLNCHDASYWDLVDFLYVFLEVSMQANCCFLDFCKRLF